MSRSVIIGVSLKAYFGHNDAVAWFREVAELASRHPGVTSGAIEMFVAPTYLQVLPALDSFAGTPVAIAAQDVAAHVGGAVTGEVCAAELAEVGVTIVEIGHAERRRLFAESDEIVALKVRRALEHELIPLLCVGESDPGDSAAAAALVSSQVIAHLSDAPAGRVIVAYEPIWAIGSREPAPTNHILEVIGSIRTTLDNLPGRGGSSVIYGGSAGPGLLASLDGSVDGVFLGRFAHDVRNLAAVLDEATAHASRDAAWGQS